ncbi:hypothetical protein KCP69_07485 [Salmonella enterica subsp. enterica]|nr:hypothetical protein KCP69_07485 [Salmonella enterica subsp. enterica]
MKDYNALGITVRYLAFPRRGWKAAEQDMKSIWCAKDKTTKRFDDANGR